jgi:hypothetical protein
MYFKSITNPESHIAGSVTFARRYFFFLYILDLVHCSPEGISALLYWWGLFGQMILRCLAAVMLLQTKRDTLVL